MIWAVLWTVLSTHLLMVNTCLYLHRGLAHRAVTWNPTATWFFRIITWFDGVNTREWVAQHRRHHVFTDVPGDPHSPVLLGIWKIAGEGFFTSCYRRYGSKPWNTPSELEIYGRGCPRGRVEEKIFSGYFLRLGIFVLLGIDVLLFQWVGVVIWLVQVAWTPLWSNTAVTGFAHHKGVHNLPWWLGFFLIGDEAHGSHHQKPSAARLSKFDLGYLYLRVASVCHWCAINE